jgi:hypothetical protein
VAGCQRRRSRDAPVRNAAGGLGLPPRGALLAVALFPGAVSAGAAPLPPRAAAARPGAPGRAARCRRGAVARQRGATAPVPTRCVVAAPVAARRGTRVGGRSAPCCSRPGRGAVPCRRRASLRAPRGCCLSVSGLSALVTCPGARSPGRFSYSSPPGRSATTAPWARRQSPAVRRVRRVGVEPGGKRGGHRPPGVGPLGPGGEDVTGLDGLPRQGRRPSPRGTCSSRRRGCTAGGPSAVCRRGAVNLDRGPPVLRRRGWGFERLVPRWSRWNQACPAVSCCRSAVLSGWTWSE